MAVWGVAGAGAVALAYKKGGAASWTFGTPTPEVMGITALTIGDAWAAFSAQNPSLFTMKAFGRKGGTEGELSKRDLRSGAAIGTGMALVVAGGASMVTRSWWPVAGTLAACAVQWAVLEHALANPWGRGGGIAHQPAGGTGG
jgi:class 3 adenylate cyclase